MIINNIEIYENKSTSLFPESPLHFLPLFQKEYVYLPIQLEKYGI